jgi:hypothetical protein
VSYELMRKYRGQAASFLLPVGGSNWGARKSQKVEQNIFITLPQ